MALQFITTLVYLCKYWISFFSIHLLKLNVLQMLLHVVFKSIIIEDREWSYISAPSRSLVCISTFVLTGQGPH